MGNWTHITHILLILILCTDNSAAAHHDMSHLTSCISAL